MNEEQTRGMVGQFQQYQQQLQAILIQKDAMQMQLMEVTKSLEELYTKHVEVASRGKAKATEKGRPASLDERLLRAYAEATYCTGTVCKRLNLPARQGSCSSPDVH